MLIARHSKGFIRHIVVMWLVQFLIFNSGAGAQSSSSVDQSLGFLLSKVSSSVTVQGSWSATKGLVDAELDTIRDTNSATQALSALGKNRGFADLSDPVVAMKFVATLRKNAVDYSTKVLTDSGLPPDIAAAISERMPRQYLYQLQRALLAYARAPKSVSEQNFRSAISGALRQSSTPLLAKSNMTRNDFKPIAEIIRRKTSVSVHTNAHFREANYRRHGGAQNSCDVDCLFAKATSQPEMLSAGLDSDILPYLSNKAQTFYQQQLTQASDKEQFIETMAQDFVQRADGLVTPASLKKLTMEQGFEVLTTVGRFQALERNTALSISQGAQNLTTGLNAATELLSADWSNQLAAARQITGNTTTLPAVSLQVANTTHLINDLGSLTSGGQLSANTIGELGSLVSQSVPDAPNIINLAKGISQIADGQASFATQGQALLGTLVSITGPGPLSQVQTAFSSVAPFIQAAGPLLALAGFATPLGGVSLVGGLLSGGMGGGGDAAALAAINQKLAEIDHKLDIVIGKLDALDNKITEQHIEIMNALESISFDVNRTRTLIVRSEVQKFSSECEDIPASFEDADLTSEAIQQKFKNCNAGLYNLSSGSEPKPILHAIYNLQTDSLQQTAYSKLQSLANVYGKSVDSAKENCFSLVMAAYSLHDIDRLSGFGMADAKSPPQAKLCEQVLSFDDMLDSGLLTFFTNLEWSFAEYSSRLGNTVSKELLWAQLPGGLLSNRWKKELNWLNVAIGQQARLTGDVTSPQWAEKLDLSAPLDDVEKQTLDQSEILAQNSVRYWIRVHLMKTDEATYGANFSTSGQPVGAALNYGFAYDACSPDYLRNLVQKGEKGDTDFSKTHFNWTSDVTDNTTKAQFLRVDDPSQLPDPCPLAASKIQRWCALYSGLGNCIALPTPDEMATGELRRSDNLEALLAARDRILTLIETKHVISNLGTDDRLKLIEALTMEWADELRHAESSQVNSGARQTELVWIPSPAIGKDPTTNPQAVAPPELK